MVRAIRHEASGMIEEQCEPGSRSGVLRNLRGVTNRHEMERLETSELARTTDHAVQALDRGHRFTADDLCRLHKEWLGSIYEWAGKYRQVLIGDNAFTFAAPAQVPRLMGSFEKDILRKYTPCTFTDQARIISALAIVHTELILIHPFRDGNGRLARLLAVLMALQAGLPLLDFSPIQEKTKDAYFSAVRSGLTRDYAPMERIFSLVVSQTLRAHRV